jgi:hypothetical protein
MHHGSYSAYGRSQSLPTIISLAVIPVPYLTGYRRPKLYTDYQEILNMQLSMDQGSVELNYDFPFPKLESYIL